MIAKGAMAALSLSSGYHTPLRFLRHLITIWSETRPTMATPTVIEGYGPSKGKIYDEPMLPIPAGRRQAPIIASFFMW